jgi:hypothetical protein
MPSPPDRRWPRVCVGYLLFVTLLAVALTPVYFLVEVAHRPTVVRLGGALVVGIAMIHLRRVVRERIEDQPSSEFAQALHQAICVPRYAPLFLKLRDEVRFSGTSQQYFEHVLWARIMALCARQSGRPPVIAPVRPAGRRLFRRGPSLAALRDLIAELEEHL